jgi:rhodanese-related sulfurtransferase
MGYEGTEQLLVRCENGKVIDPASETDRRAELPENKKTKLALYMNPSEVVDRMSRQLAETLFLDIRTRSEVAVLGMPTAADANVPYMEASEWHPWDTARENFKWEPNPGFATEVARRLDQKGLAKHDAIILICRSGLRSAKAANLLADLGYTQVFSVPEGYEGDKAESGPQKGQRVVNGWKNAGLPWSYKLDKAKMYKVGE